MSRDTFRRRIRDPSQKPIDRPAVHDPVGRNAGQARVCHRGLGICQLTRRMRVAVEGEEAARFQRASGQGVIEVLSRRIAIDLNRDAALCRRRKHGVPIGDDACARAGDPTARVRQNANRRMLRRLRACVRSGPRSCGAANAARPVPRRRRPPRRQPDPADQRRRCSLRCPVRAGIALPRLSVDAVDGPPLVSGFGHRHAAGDLQAVRVVGDRRVSIAALQGRRRRSAGPSDSRRSIRSASADRRGNPRAMGPSNAGSRRIAQDLRATEKVPPKLTPPLDVRPPFAGVDRVLDGGRLASVQNLADDPCGAGPDARDSGRAPSGPTRSVNGRRARESPRPPACSRTSSAATTVRTPSREDIRRRRR